MSIPIQFYTAVLKKTAIRSQYPGGLARFLQDLPPGLPEDGNFVGVIFMSGGELQEFLDMLLAIGFDLKNSCAVGEMVLGELDHCPGIDFRAGNGIGVMGAGWIACTPEEAQTKSDSTKVFGETADMPKPLTGPLSRDAALRLAQMKAAGVPLTVAGWLDFYYPAGAPNPVPAEILAEARAALATLIPPGYNQEGWEETLAYERDRHRQRMPFKESNGKLGTPMSTLTDSLPLLPGLPPRPEGFKGVFTHFGGSAPADCPRELPRTAKYVASVEWSWAPSNGRQDHYSLSTNRTRSNWILWIGYFDDENSKYVYQPYAFGPWRGVEARTAAIYLLLDAWQGEVDAEGSPDAFHAVTSDGLLSSEDLLLMRMIVWNRVA